MALLWQTSSAAVLTYCTMGDKAVGLATTFQNAAENPDHKAMRDVDDALHGEEDCCGADKSEKGCVMTGCALSMQMLAPTVTAPAASGTRE